MFCYVLSCSVMICYVLMFCYVLLCFVMFCYVLLCSVMICNVLMFYVLLCFYFWLFVMFWLNHVTCFVNFSCTTNKLHSLKGLLLEIQVTLHLKMEMLDSQWQTFPSKILRRTLSFCSLKITRFLQFTTSFLKAVCAHF